MAPVSLAKLAALFSALFALPATAENFKTPFPEAYSQIEPEDQAATGALELQHGKMELTDGTAEITLPNAFYMLNAKDARYVLERFWPPRWHDPSTNHAKRQHHTF